MNIDEVLWEMDPVGIGAFQEVTDALRAKGYQIIEPEPESFVRKINGREAILVRSRL